jgi:hypothetical protein
MTSSLPRSGGSLGCSPSLRIAATRRAEEVCGAERSVAYCLAGIASVLADSGRDEDAATIWGAVCAAEETLGFRMRAPERHRYEGHLARLEVRPAWIEGKRLTLEETVAMIPTS